MKGNNLYELSMDIFFTIIVCGWGATCFIGWVIGMKRLLSENVTKRK